MNNRARSQSGDMIARFKEFYGYRFDTEMARRLGLSDGSAIGNWRRRNTLDLLLIAELCPEINMDWLIWGRGSRMPILNDDHSNGLQPTMLKHEIIQLVNEALEQYLQRTNAPPDQEPS